MDLKLFEHKGVPLERQRFTWRELVQKPISKLDDDAFTRVRIILMNGIEADAMRFKHLCARRDLELRLPLANIRRSEQHQATMVNWLIGADHSPLETTIAYEQTAVEVTASVAQNEPDADMAELSLWRVLEEFDHLYRYSALLDRLEGKDSNNILQGYTDVAPGRPTAVEHRAPQDDMRNPYALDAAPLTKIYATMITAAEYQTHNYYMNIGPYFADPLARLLYAEIASIEEQHVTQYGSLINPDESWLEHWLVHEAMEAYAYHSCMEEETNPRIRAIWERFLDYELGHFRAVAKLMQVEGKRDPEAIFGAALDRRIEFKPQRDFYRAVLEAEVDVRAKGVAFVPAAIEHEASIEYRSHLNSAGSPSSVVAAGYRWAPGHGARAQSRHHVSGRSIRAHGGGERAVSTVFAAGRRGSGRAASRRIRAGGRSARLRTATRDVEERADRLRKTHRKEPRGAGRQNRGAPCPRAQRRAAVRSVHGQVPRAPKWRFEHPTGRAGGDLRRRGAAFQAAGRRAGIARDRSYRAEPVRRRGRHLLHGRMQLLSDPRTSLPQALTGLLTVELADNAAWELLIQLAEQAGQDTAATQFAAALEEEQRHLELVRRWLRRKLLGQADGGL